MDTGQARTTDVLSRLTYSNAGYLGTAETWRGSWEQGFSLHLCASTEPPESYVHLYVCVRFTQVIS